MVQSTIHEGLLSFTMTLCRCAAVCQSGTEGLSQAFYGPFCPFLRPKQEPEVAWESASESYRHARAVRLRGAQLLPCTCLNDAQMNYLSTY